MSRHAPGHIGQALAVVAMMSIGTSSAAQTRPVNQPLLTLEIETTRPRFEAGANLGVAAIITNTSDSVLHLYESGLDIVVPIELAGAGGQTQTEVYPAYFPSRDFPGGADSTKLILQPGDRFRAHWDVGSGSVGVLKRIGNQFSFLFFSPGQYEIGVTGKYWTVADPEAPYRTVTATAQVEVAAPQFVVLFGAALGGLMAFALTLALRYKRALKQGKKVVFTIIGINLVFISTILLSIVITILLARISETDFFIRVTVNDFWGAIAIGFMAGYAGERFLRGLVHEE
jgi:hypothetical protein